MASSHVKRVYLELSMFCGLEYVQPNEEELAGFVDKHLPRLRDIAKDDPRIRLDCTVKVRLSTFSGIVWTKVSLVKPQGD